jgi:CcmD family protein
MLKRFALVCCLCALSVTAVSPVFALQPPTTSQDKFVPIDQLPPTEKLPAAPFLISAYAIVWLIAMFYIWTIWQRVNRLEGEFRTLERRSRPGNPR